MKEKNETLLIRFNMILLMLVFTLIVLSCKREFPEKEIINHFNKYDLLSRKLSKEGKIDSALFYANELVNIASIKNDSSLLSRAYYKKGLYHRKKRRVDSAYFYYKKSNEINQKLKDSLKIVKRFFNIASLESENELYLKSDSTAIEGLKYSMNKPKFNSIICSIYNCLGINYRNEGHYKEAISNYNLAIRTTNDSLKKIRYRANIAVVYKYDKKYDKSINLYRNIINNEFFNEVNLKLKFRILDNFTYVKYLAGKKIDVKDFFRTEKLKDSINDKEGLITNYSYISGYFFNKNKEKSLFYANKMYGLAKETKRPNDRIEAIDRLISLVNDNVVRKYAKERSYLKDSIISARRNSRNKLVKIIYNFDLLEKQKLKAQIDVEQQKSQKQLWVFIGLTTFLGFIVYFFYKRNKTKKEKIIEVYKTETRLAKKIHDELANDVYLAMNKIQKENREDTSVLCDLEKIYSLTRNISHENSPVVTGEQFEDFLKQLFLEFSIDTCRVMSKGLSEVQVNTLAKEKQIVMYRVLQELLVNMKKHSKANLVVISFSVLKGTIQVRYKDNGIGIDNLSLKNGLQNMETRIKSIGGTIIFESEIQKGFQAKFQLKK